MRVRNFKPINAIILLFIIIVTMTGIAYSLLKQDIRISGTATINNLPENEKGEVYTTYLIKNSWNSNGRFYYLVEMTLHNNSDQELSGWKVSTKLPPNAKLENFSGTIPNNDETHIHFNNESYNANIASKGKVTFEFQISTTDANYNPSDIIINGETQKPDVPGGPNKPETGDKKAEVTYVLDNSWSSGKKAFSQFTITIKNTGDLTISSWKFDIALKGNTSIDQAWNANYTENNKGFTFSNTTYNGKIDVNNETSFGVIISSNKKIETLEIKNIIVN